jgi:aryl-alcohol dehydrogenase-like predicted oxidoreductase
VNQREITARVGLGLAALGRPAYITAGRDEDLGQDRTVAQMERRSHEVLDTAYEAGVRYVDVARSYGLAEAFLSSWLGSRDIPFGALTVGSKWGYVYTGGWRMDVDVHEVKDHSVGTFRRHLGETCELLGDWLTLYQIHSVTADDDTLGDRALLGELWRLHDDGLRVGLTVSGPRQAEVVWRALEVEEDGRNPFSSVQATWNLLDPSVSPALADASDRGWTVIVKEVLANGRLTPHDVGVCAAADPLGSVAARHRVGGDAVAVAAALANPWASTVLSGAATSSQLLSNLIATTVKLTADDLTELGSLAETPDNYWAARSARPWT